MIEIQETMLTILGFVLAMIIISKDSEEYQDWIIDGLTGFAGICAVATLYRIWV